LEAKRLKMHAWLYDEDKWPSGFAGGIVPKMGAKYRQKALVCSINKEFEENVELLRTFKFDGKTLRFYLWVAPLGDRWFNNTSYVDLMSSEVVKAFLDSTYESYYKRFKRYFRTTVPGIFTDEPCYLMWNVVPHPCVPWTLDMPKRFTDRYGYDILDRLPSLFYDKEDSRQVRYDFWRLASEMFLEAFGKQVFEWCSEHHLVFTGHYMAEDNLPHQMDWTGGPTSYYEYMHYPGIDHLSRNINDALTVKQVSSVADQLGKARVLSETYGCSGWNLTFEGQKWISEWQIALGINLINPHLSLYSSRGKRKRDYPPSLHYQQPWWNQYKIINDHLTRLCALMSQGERICDMLLIHPIESSWAIHKPDVETPTQRLSKSLVDIVESLLGWQRDFHLGDERIMGSHGRVFDAKLWIGRYGYSIVVVPPSVTLRRSTVNLIREFLKQGGKVVFIDEPPTLIEGRQTYEINDIVRDCVRTGDLRHVLDSIHEFGVEVRGSNSENVYCHRRRIGNTEALFAVNISQEKRVEGEIFVRSVAGNWEEWNPTDGETKAIMSDFEGGVHRIPVSFDPTQSHLFILSNLNRPFKQAGQSLRQRTIVLDGLWDFKAVSQNALTLDTCRYRLYRNDWSERVPIYKAQDFVGKNRGRVVEFEFIFALRDVSTSRDPIFLVMERPTEFQIRLNDQKLPSEDVGWWTDISFRKIRISTNLRKGENRIVLKTRLKQDTELESIYVLGTFGVEREGSVDFSLVKAPSRLGTGDLVSSGYPFLSGRVRYKKDFLVERGYSQASMEIERLDGVLLNLKVNGKKAGTIAWHPLSLDVSGYLRKGKNTVEIELVSSCRNLLGPHHRRTGEPLFVHPGSWSDEGDWTDEYKFVPFGLTTAPKIVFTSRGEQ
jgi:hypothetical protein